MRMAPPNTGNSPKTEILTIVRNLLISTSPEDLEDMLFHLFEDANLQEGELQRDEKLLRHEFHLAIRRILRILMKNPEILDELKKSKLLFEWFEPVVKSRLFLLV